MKVFISQPMAGKTEEEIRKKREAAEAKIIEYYPGERVEFLDTVFDFPGEPALFYLGKSLEALCKADLAAFMPGWPRARGCWIEFECCKRYGVPTLDLEEEGL